MKSRKPITAFELGKQLENDPKYQSMIQEKEQRRALFKKELEADERELVEEIKANGFEVESVWDFVNNSWHPFLERNFLGPYKDAYPILVAHLDKPHHPRIREGIIRALTVKDAREIAKDKLLENFYTETDKELKWVISSALTTILTPTEKRKNPDVKLVRKSDR